MPDERKSTRLAKRTTKAAISDNYQDDSDSESHEEGLVNTKRFSAAKRKASGNTSSLKKQPPKKKLKGTRGLLSDVVEMPLDILFEIFVNLLPIDLWNLARTSKDLRSILINSTSAFVWRKARKNDPHQIPDCPSEMSEPEYAALCYAKHCTTCLKVTPFPYHIWAERVRLCRKCVNAECEGFPDDLPVGFLSADVLPWVRLPGRDHNVVYRVALNSLRKIFQKLKKSGCEEAIWTSELVEEMKERETHARECERWLRRKQNDIEAEKGMIIDQRRAEVMTYVKQLGWSEELVDFSITTKAIEDCTAITKVCHKKITEQTLTGLEQTLNTFFSHLTVKHIKWKIEKKLKDRLPLLSKARDKFAAPFPLNVPVISTIDLFHVPDVHGVIVDTPFSTTPSEIATMLESVSQQFPQYMEEWQNKQKESLRKMVEDAYGPEYLTGIEGDILNLATSFFDCSGCKWFPIWPARAMTHRHCIEADWGYGAPNTNKLTDDQKIEFDTVATVLRQRRWNELGRLTFNKSRSVMVGEVIQLCGYDPKKITVEELNNADPILECLTCHSIYKGRIFMQWSRIVNHYQRSHSDSGYNINNTKMLLKVVDGSELAFVRLQLNHKKEREHSSRVDTNSLCTRCFHQGNIPDLKMHWKEVHKEPPVDGCILRKLDTSNEVEEHTLWPPLEPEELASAGGTEIILKR